MRIIATLLVITIFLVTTPFALSFEDATYGIEMLVKKGEKSKEADSKLTLSENTFTATPKKEKYKSQSKTFEYSAVEAADYSYAKKPLLSTGGAITSVIFLGLIALPFLFMKKKRHWLSIRTEDDFAVMKLQKSNYMQVLADFKTRGVEITTVDEKNAAKPEKKKEVDQSGGESASDNH